MGNDMILPIADAYTRLGKPITLQRNHYTWQDNLPRNQPEWVGVIYLTPNASHPDPSCWVDRRPVTLTFRFRSKEVWFFWSVMCSNHHILCTWGDGCFFCSLRKQLALSFSRILTSALMSNKVHPDSVPVGQTRMRACGSSADHQSSYDISQ